MGVDLKLIIPMNSKPIDNLSYLGHSEIALDRCRELWDHINLINKKTRVNSVSCYHYYDEEKEVHCYGEINEDQYGRPLYSVTADILGNMFEGFNHNGYPINEAIAPFLLALPKDWPIILYWC